ncbi:DNA-3-methyladenine glycosylase family protein [Nonomuraea sp. NPDC050328]|uniref:DNA-3-methyladenine glycosylase family protein n=1 Tax=Nonomuraea sp. NPDC050328 TaxID=3364361 RepID=UPI003793B03A
MEERAWVPEGPLDVGQVLGPHQHGGGDPTWRRTPDGTIWRACRTPDGPGTLRIGVREGAVLGQAWGPGARWLLETMPALLAAGDDVSGFVAHHRVLGEAARRHPGRIRIGRSGRVMEALVPAILEQKVVGQEAWRAWRWLLHRYGTPAPGPAPEGLRVVPEPEVWRQIPAWDWHRAGAEAVRARTIATAAWHADKLETAATSAEADRLLRALPGIGVWTSAEVRQRAFGDPDAVSVGDFHLAKIVGYALTGEKTDDEGMLRLLEPYAGHRHRATMLVGLTGLRPPARGPRLAARDYRSF